VTAASTKRALAAALLLVPIAAAQEKRLDATHSVALTEVPGKTAGQWSLQLISSVADPIALDSSSNGAVQGTPTLEVIPPNFAYLHFYSDYGFYNGSVKYVFDIAAAKPVLKIPYRILALTSVARKDGKLYYSASGKTISVEPRGAGLPSYRIAGGDASGAERTEPIEVRAPSGEVAQIQNTTPPGQSHRASTIFVGSGRSRQSYPAPIPTLDFYRQMLPQKQPPGEMESDIGPFVQSGETIWFATTFYDSEGTSGIGAIGSFDMASREYKVRYLPEIAPWSGSAILLDGDELWIGLMRRPEGADIAAGLLRYNIRTGAVQTFTIPDYIHTIDRAGDALYCGTSHGLYVVRGATITQLRFEPDAAGKLVMIPRSNEK
jgi:hypothetical protein